MTKPEAVTPIADSLRDHGSKYYNHPRYDEKLIKAIEKLEKELASANAEIETLRAELGKFSERNVYALRDQLKEANAKLERQRRAFERFEQQVRDIAGEAFLNWRALLQERCAEARETLEDK